MRVPAKIAMLFAGLMLLWGCSQNPQVAGGDDYPNSVNTLGKQSAQESRDTSEWNAYRDAPSNAPGLYDNTPVPDSVSPMQPTTVSDSFSLFTDSNSGRITLVHVHHAETLQSVDSTLYQPDLSGLGKPLVVRFSGSTLYTNGVEKRYAYQDADGDGFLSARQQATNIASIHLTTLLPSGETQEKNLRVEAGPDFNFNIHGDNRLLALEQTDRIGPDTLSYLLVQDADGDGRIYDPASATGNSIDVQKKNHDPVAGVKTVLTYRILAFADSTQNRPVRFHRVIERNGGTQETWALGRDSLPNFAAGDSGWVKTVFTPASTDTLSQSTSLYSVLLSNTPNHFSGNSLHSVDRIKSYRLGGESQLHFHLQPDTIISDGHFPLTGALNVRLDFTSGKWVQMQGDATSTEISGLITDSQGRQGMVHFDLQGELKFTSGL